MTRKTVGIVFSIGLAFAAFLACDKAPVSAIEPAVNLTGQAPPHSPPASAVPLTNTLSGYLVENSPEPGLMLQPQVLTHVE